MKDKWDLSKIYSSREEYDKDRDLARKNIEEIGGLKEDFKANFKEILEKLVETSEIVSKSYAFSHMTRDEDSTIAKGQELALEADNLLNEFRSASSFFTPSILDLSEDQLEDLIEENDLEDYRKYLTDIFRFKDHTLSKEEEYIMGSISQMANAPSNAYYMLTNADMEFKDIESKGGEELSNANYTNFLKDKDVEVRKEAFTNMYQAYGSVANTTSTLYSDNVNNLVTEARLRNYESALEMELYEDDVPVSVYNNLIDSVRDNLDSLHNYYMIKKDALGLEEQHMYDVYLPLAGDLDIEITYEEAADIIKKAVQPMGDEYVEVLSSAFDNDWIDVYPRKGKRAGAYSWGVYSSDPYILMNYTDDLSSLFTLAHELGHSMHSYFSNKNNPYIYSNYTIFAAEVASTTNELLVLNYLLDNTDDKDKKIYLINHYIDSFKSTVFRQTMFAEFEKNTHQRLEDGGVLTLDYMNDMYYKLNEDYYGDSVVIDDSIKLEWSRIPHFYRNFYVYKYATGFLSAVILSDKILKGENTKEYLEFLSDGSNHFPIDQLKHGGADIKDPATFGEAFRIFRKLVKDLDLLVG